MAESPSTSNFIFTLLPLLLFTQHHHLIHEPQDYQQSPLRVRRSQRRAAPRAEKASAEVLDLANVIASEKAVIYSTPNEYATDEAENAVQTEQVVSSTEDVNSDKASLANQLLSTKLLRMP